MKKSLAIYVLNIILFVNLTGCMLSFFVRQYAIRVNVSRLIESEESSHLSRLVFSHTAYSALPKFDGGKEFKLTGKMYDVKSITFTGDSVLVNAYCDEDETELIDGLLGFFEIEKRNGIVDTTIRFSLVEFVYEFSYFTCINNEVCIVLYDVSRQMIIQASPCFIAPPPDC